MGRLHPGLCQRCQELVAPLIGSSVGDEAGSTTEAGHGHGLVEALAARGGDQFGSECRPARPGPVRHPYRQVDVRPPDENHIFRGGGWDVAAHHEPPCDARAVSRNRADSRMR